MSKRLLGTLGFLAGAFFLFALTPVSRAENVDERIKALEQQLIQLKAEQQHVRDEQIELKKQATEAAAALPTFAYRPRSGMTITAADKSWAFNISSQFHLRMYNYVDGNDSDGAVAGKLFGRRITLFTNYCWSNCFYDFDLQFDMDQNNIPLELQRAQLDFHFNQFNPYLPTLRVGLDAAASKAHLVSSSSSARWERNTVNDDSSTLVTGSHQGIGFVWDSVPIGPGTFGLETHLVTGRLGAGDSATTNSDMMSFHGYFGIRPFASIKNKWLSGFEIRSELSLEPVDDRAGVAADAGGTGAGNYRRQRLRTDERLGRLTIADTGNNAVGGGLHKFWQPGIIYRVGPYTFNALYTKSDWRGENDAFAGVVATHFAFSHELYLLSPKGAFTGSSSTPGSVLLGFSWSRADMDCGVGADCAPGAGRFRQVYLLQRETNLWYTVMNGLRVGLQWNWWEASNSTAAVQSATNCSRNTNTANVGKSCDWHTINGTVAFNW